MEEKEIWLEEESGQNRLLAAQVRLADSFWPRLKGLLGTAALPEGQGLLLRPCNSVHTFGMQYALDVVFLDSSWGIRKIVPDLASWRGACCWGAAAVLELPAGTAHRQDLKVGQQLRCSQPACVRTVKHG